MHVFMEHTKVNFKIMIYKLKYIEIASKPTSIVTILTNIALAGEHIFQVLAQ